MATKKAKRLAPLHKTLRELYLKSGNWCAFPECQRLMMNSNGNFIGQVAHIEAAEEGGPRFNPGQTNEDRRHFSNLMLMCYEHHKITDDVTTYTVEVLRKMKTDHEAKFTDVARAIGEASTTAVKLPGASIPGGVNFPTVLEGRAKAAVQYENSGNLEAAEKAFAELLRELESERPAANWVAERRQLNRNLGSLRREMNKGIPGPTRIPVLKEENGKFVIDGECTKEDAHRRGSSKLHATCICLYRWPDGGVAYYVRQPWQSFDGKLDFFGGHMETRDRTPFENCLRECNEELRLYVFGEPIAIHPDWIKQVGADYSLEWPIPDPPPHLVSGPDFENRERSTLWVIRLPQHGGIEVRAGDDDKTGHQYRPIPAECIRHEPFDELIGKMSRFADGGYRVLHRCENDAEFKGSVCDALK